MANPTRKHSRSRRGNRRGSSWKYILPSLTPCPHCGKPILPHRVCPHCGSYRGRQVTAVKERTAAEAKSSAP